MQLSMEMEKKKAGIEKQDTGNLPSSANQDNSIASRTAGALIDNITSQVSSKIKSTNTVSKDLPDLNNSQAKRMKFEEAKSEILPDHKLPLGSCVVGHR